MVTSDRQVQFMIGHGSNVQDNAHFLTLISSHPNIQTVTTSRSGKTFTFTFNLPESLTDWLTSFNTFRLSLNTDNLQITELKSTKSSKYRVDCIKFIEDTLYQSTKTDPTLTILNHLPFLHLITLTGGCLVNSTDDKLVFDNSISFNRFTNLLANSAPQLQNEMQVQQNTIANNLRKSLQNDRVAVPSRNSVTLKSNTAFRITTTDPKLLKKAITDIHPTAVFLELPPEVPLFQPVVHVQFPQKAQAELFLSFLKSKDSQQLIISKYKVVQLLDLHVPSSFHQVLTCFITFKSAPTHDIVKQLLPKSVTTFDISKSPNPKNSSQWFIHAEFASAAHAQENLIPLLTTLKQLCPTNLVFPTRNFYTIYDKQRGISCHLDIPQDNWENCSHQPAQKQSQIFSEKFRAVDRGKFGFVKVNCLRETITTLFGSDFMISDCIFTSPEKIKDALHGDTVNFTINLEKLFNEKTRKEVDLTADSLNTARFIGQVVSVEKRGRENLVGMFRPSYVETDTWVFTPSLSNLPQFYYRGQELLKTEALYKAKIDPKTRFIQEPSLLNEAENGGKSIDTFLHQAMEQIIVLSNISKESWSEEILSEVPAKTATCRDFPEGYTADRRDFRDDCVFTIDPRTCRDMDDAIHIKRLDPNTLEIGVHIADVSFFVNPKTSPKLYEHARVTSTSFYFPDRVYHMLPSELSANLCSLCPHEDRFTLSMTWKVSAGDLVIQKNSFWYGRGIIRSRAKLAYEDTQLIFDFFDQYKKIPTVAEMVEIFSQSDTINQHLDNYTRINSKFQNETDLGNVITSAIHLLLFTRKLESGRNRLIIHSRMSQFVAFNLSKESGAPLDISPTKTIEANRVIENLMLLANEYAAITISKKHGENALLRIHPGLNVQDLIKRLVSLKSITQNQGLLQIIDMLTSTVVSQTSGDISTILSSLESTELKIFFSTLLSMNMNPAEYKIPSSLKEKEADSLRHFALNLDLYTHFTSPIRRFPDILVHQQLLNARDSNMEGLEHNCTIANERKLASRESQAMADLAFFACFLNINYGKSGMWVKGMVQSVLENCTQISIPAFGGAMFNIRYHLLENVKKSKFFAASNAVEVLTKNNESKIIKTFDLLEVRLACPELDVMLDDPISITEISWRS